MTCIKTGAHIYLAPYDEYLYGDAFEVNGVYYFRICERSLKPLLPVLHFIVNDYANWFDKDTARDSTLVATHCHNHGYEGVPI